MTQEILVNDAEGIRIDLYLSRCCEDFSRSYLQKLLKDGCVLIDGHAVKSSYKVTSGQTIFLTLPEPQKPEILPEELNLDVLYEDKDILIVNKPKGMVVHPAAGHFSGTLVNGLMAHCREELSGINGVLRPGIVHRIDKDTTGALIVCKNDQAHRDIAEQLKIHSITRVYCAIVHGRILEDNGTVDAPIGRHPVDRKKMSINEKNGKAAVTHFHVIRRFQRFTYIECRLETGRTHQIRVHMASIGHPLLGDVVYGPAKCPISGLEGQTLHAKIIGINHPRTHEYLEVHAPLPQYFEELLKKLK